MSHLLKKAFVLFILCALLTDVRAQSNSHLGKIAPADLKSDFMLFRDTLQKIHPALYRYSSKATIDHIFDSCLATIRDSMPVTDFYALTSFAMAAIGDGHANCRLPDQVMNEYRSNVKIFPAMVLFINNKAFIYCCKQNTMLAGTELLSINGQSMDVIIRRLFSYITTDGNIQSRKNWEMPEFFHILYNTIYGEKSSFYITYKTNTGEIERATLQPDLQKNIICPSPFSRPTKYLELHYTSDKIAILTVKTFFDGFLEKTGENYTRFLDSAFNDIKEKKVKKLIIDGRRNQGGYDHNGEILYSYLTSKPFLYYASQETVNGNITVSQNHDIGLQQPMGNSFDGKVYFLMDGRSFSATAEFSAVAKTNNRGLFIGEETGGGYYGNTSGGEANVSLPNTQIRCRIPLIKYTMAVKKARYIDRGVIPDYHVYPTIVDLVEGKDGQMEYALKVARHK